jgi:hypothetical protein
MVPGTNTRFIEIEGSGTKLNIAHRSREFIGGTARINFYNGVFTAIQNSLD